MRRIPISFATNIVHTALLKWFNRVTTTYTTDLL